MGLDLWHGPALQRPLHGPTQGLPQRLAQHRSTGLADGHQAGLSPLLRTGLLQLDHDATVRQEDEIEVPGLALTTPELTLAHAQLLLPVPMEGLGAGPALAIGPQNTIECDQNPSVG